jgi:hypothetical protein
MQHEYARALSAARFFRKIGLVPLPSRMDRKQPTFSEFKQFRSEPVPKVVYSEDEWKTTNLQIMTGAQTGGATKVVVIDLDGEMAPEAWKRICKAHDHKPQGIWIAETGSGGKHLYYRLPPELERCQTRLLWGLYDPLGGPKGEGGWMKHMAIQLLGDGVLAVAPPSRHVSTGKEYRWIGKWSPAVFPLPAEAPRWLIDMPGLSLPIKKTVAHGESVRRDNPVPRRMHPDGKGPDRDAVIAAIPPTEKLRLAQEWGLRLARNSDGRGGWVECHAIGRDDKTPSAGFDPKTGVYHDFGSATKLSFFDLAVSLGAYRSWLDALNSIALAVRS